MTTKDIIHNENKKEKKETKKDDLKWQYGTAPSLMINMVRENRVYRFEMPIGAKLAECVEACTKCVDVVKQMQEESFAKMREAEKKKKEEEPSSKDSGFKEK